MKVPMCNCQVGYWQGRCISCDTKEAEVLTPVYSPLLWLSLGAALGAAAVWAFVMVVLP